MKTKLIAVCDAVVATEREQLVEIYTRQGTGANNCIALCARGRHGQEVVLALLYAKGIYLGHAGRVALDDLGMESSNTGQINVIDLPSSP